MSGKYKIGEVIPPCAQVRRSPEVMRAWEADADHTKCDGCNLTLTKDEPVMVINMHTTVCGSCLRWAMPQIESLEDNEP